jgi:hypothetical protein
VTVELSQVVTELDIAEGAEVLQLHWEDSQRTMPREGIFFLEPAFVMPREIALKGVAVAEIIAASPALSALAWHFHYCLFRTEGYGKARDWPYPESVLGSDTGTLFTLVLLSGIPEMQAIHERHHIPKKVIRDTLAQINWGLNDYLEEDGAWGLRPTYVGWLMNHLTGVLYHLVRLQFQFGSFTDRLRVFRNRADARKLVMSSPGLVFRADGQILRDGDDDAGSWTAELSVTDEAITGNAIDPRGFALAEPLTLSADEWERVVAPGDPVLNIHIPTGGPMDFDECGQSFAAVPDFFAKHFPEREWRCICCHSWLLDSAIQEIRPDTANLVRFQREVYLFPIGLSDTSLAGNLFDELPVDPATAPRDTSFQRAYLERLESGEPPMPGAGGCLLFMEDFDWGAQVYLTGKRAAIIGPSSTDGERM